jgi:hypothetical protein
MFRVNLTQQCQHANGLKMKEISKHYLSGLIFNFFYWLFSNYLLCRQVSGMAEETGNQNPLDPMDTDGEEDETAKVTDDLLKDAESLLNSPSARKEPQSNNVIEGADSAAGAGSVTGAASDTGTDGKKMMIPVKKPVMCPSRAVLVILTCLKTQACHIKPILI